MEDRFEILVGHGAVSMTMIMMIILIIIMIIIIIIIMPDMND